MADLPPLRQTENGATSAERDALRGAPVRAAAALALAAAVFLAVVAIAGLGRLDADVVFLQNALGPERAQAPLSRRPAPGVDVRIHDEGYTVSHKGASFSVVSQDVGDAEWKRHVYGVTRETDFGAETIVVKNGRTEEFLTVAERQGERTWRWQLATRLVPHISTGGKVCFLDPTRKHSADISLDRVRILDEHGRDITPKGLRWGLDDDGGTWWLTLKLDDSKLPLPYVIDPAANYPTPLNLRSTATSDTGSWDLDGGTGTLDTTTDNTPGQNATGWYAWNPSAANTTRLTTIPTTTDGNGWIVDPAGGATGFPAGNWSFTVVTDIPNTTLTAGTAILTVGVWKGTVSGSAFTPTGTILTPTDDPAAQNLRTTVNPKTTTVTYSLPAFSLAAGETLFVDYWRHQTGGINTFTASRRRLDFYVNDGNAFITHPAADDTAPSHSLTVTELTNPGGQYFDATTATQYYNTAAGGTFRVNDAATDAGAGVASVTFPALAATGFTHTSVTDTTGPYQSNTYTWTTANTTSPGSQAVSAVDNALNSSSPSPQLTLTRDVTAPSGQTLSLVGGPYYTSLSVSLTAGDGSDGGSGLDTSSRLYERDSATLTDGSCGAFSGSWTTVANPDATVASGTCYRYRYSIADNVGNRSATVTASVDAKVDTSAPAAPSLSLAENPADPDQHVSATTLYYKPGANGGTFRVTASASDGQSGIASVAFPAIANVTGGGSDASSPYEMDYTWGATTVATGNQNVTATNNAGLTSANGPFTLTQDSTAPSGQTLSLVGGPYYTSLSVSLTAGDGSDGGSGLDTSSRLYERDSATLTNGSCGAFSGSWTTVANPDATVASGTCYRYRYSIADNVGNRSATVTASVDAKVDTSAPAAPSLSLAENPADPDQHVSATTLYYKPGANGGTFRVTASASDGQSGIASVAFPAIANVTGGGSDASSPYEMDYTWGATTVATGNQNVTATNNAGLTSANGPFTLTQDSTAPTGQTLSLVGGPYYTSLSVSLTAGDGSDGGSGLDTSSRLYERDSATLTNGSCGAFSGSWTTVANPDATVASGTCYRYRYSIADNVGNRSATVTASVDAKVDTSAPAAPSLSLAENPADPDQHVSATTLYYKPGANGGTFRVTASASDGQSGIASVAFPAIANVTGGGSDASSPYEMDYTWGATTVATGDQDVTATNNAGLAGAAAAFAFRQDGSVPSTTDDTASIGSGWKTTSQVVTLTPDDGAGSGVAATYYTTDGSTPTTSSAQGMTISLTADGIYTIKYFSVDNVGNDEPVRTASTQIRIDGTDPSSATLDALPGAIRNGQELTGSGADAGSGVDSITYLYCSGTSCTPATPIGSSSTGPDYSVTWSSMPADGNVRVLARVFDVAGNTLDSTIQDVVVDNTNPTGSLTAPADAAFVAGSVPVSSSSADSGSGVASAQFERRPAGGGAWTSIGTDVTSPYSVSWDTTSLADGDYDLRVVTSDQAGNTFTSSTRTVTVDNASPSVTIVAPTGFVNGGSADPFTMTATTPDGDVDQVEFFSCSNASAACGSGTWVSLGTDTSAPYSAPWTIDVDGNRALRAVATDHASNTGADVVQVTIDRTDPTGSLTAPANGAFLVGTVAVSSSSADSGSGVASAQFERRPAGGGAWTSIGTDVTSPYSVSWDTTSLADGDYDLRVVTSDQAGNTFTSSTRTVTVDNTAPSAPVITLSESSPYAFVAGTEIFLNTNEFDSYDVSATSSDAASGIAKVTFPGGIDDLSSPYQTSYGFLDLFGTQTVTATNGAGLTAAADFEVSEDVDAPTGGSVAYTGGYDADGQVAVSVDAGSDPLSGIAAGTGVLERRTSTLTGNACAAFSGGWSTVTSPDTLASGLCAQYRYRVFDHVQNEATYTSGAVVKVDLSAPAAPVITLSESSPYAFVAGTEIFLNTNEFDSYDVSATSSDGASGIAKVTFPGGIDDLSSPYQTSYGFLDLFGTQTVTATNGAGLTAAADFEVSEDVDAPTGGSVAYTGGYDADGQVAVSVDAGSDPLSGIAAGTGVLERRTSTLTGNACAAFSGGWSTVTSPDTLASGLCAQYRYRVFDHVQNEATYTSGAVVKVDLSAPAAPVITLSESSPYAFVAGTEIFLNTNEFDSYDVSATSSDAASGIAKVTFPGGIDDLSSPYQTSYGFLDLFGTQTVTATNGAGLTAAADFEVSEDVDAPTGGSVAYTGGYDADGQVAVSVDAGSDPLSGIAAGTGVLERRTSTLTGNACAAFSGGWSTVTSPDTLASGLCAQYRYRVFDHVQNEATYTSGAVVKVDLSAPAAPVITLSESSPYAFVAGTEIFLNTNEFDSYDVSATSSDGASGIAKVTFPGGIDDLSSPYQTSYGFLDLFGTQTVTATNGAGLTAAADFEVSEDVDAPTGGSVAYTGGYDADGQVAVSVDAGSDPLSGIAAGTGVLERRTSTLTGNACAAFSGGWSTVTSPDTLASGLCAQYRYRVFDHVQNEATYTSGAVVKVDLSAPAAPVITLSESSPYAFVAGTEIFLNTNEFDSYDVSATSSDGASGIAKVTFPGGIDDLSSPYQTSYGFLDLFGTQTVTATNGAGLTAAADFEVSEDVDAPSTSDDTSSIGTAWQTAPVTLTLTPGDSGAGVAATYYTTDGSLPTTSSAQGTTINLSADGVYVIRYFSVDRVGNVEPVRTAFDVIRIDKTDPAQPTITLSESSPYAYVSGSEIFVNTGQSGSYDVSATSSDATAGIERMSFPGGVDDVTSPYGTSYGLGDLSGVQTVTAHDYAGNTASDTFTVTPDAAAPTGGSVAYADGYDADGQVAVSVDAGSDPLSGIAAGTGVLERRTSTLTGNACAAFSGGWSTVTSPDTLASGLCAQYRYRVFDHVQNEATYTSGAVVKVDLDGPQTTIDSAPSDPSSDTSPSFDFSSNEPGATFECRLDAGAWTACTSPESVGPLADGSHDFEVRATDGAGNSDATPASHTWTIDTVAPQTTIVLVPADPSNDDAPTFEFESDEPGAAFECRVDAGAWTPCTSPEVAGLLADGSHTFEVRAIDGAGNTDPTPASYTWTVDTAAPDTTFTTVPGSPSNNASPSFEFDSSEPGSSFECRLDGSFDWDPCASPATVGPLVDGGHTFDVRATDPAGNTDGTPASHTWTVDTGAPPVSITQPSGFVNASDADPYTVRATSPDADVASVEFFSCSDASAACAGGSWISLGTDSTVPFEASWPVDPDGNRALRAVATDTASNVGSVVIDVTIDRTVPDTTIDSAPSDPSSDTSPSFDFSSNEPGATFECRLDAGAWTACTSPEAYSGLADGSHTFRARATDGAGNTDATPAAYSWTVDTTAPQTTIDSSPSNPSSSAAPSFDFSSSEPGSTFECRLDAGAWTACTSPEAYSGLADGSHTFSVRATDAAGNADPTPASYTWTVDATPPGGGLADPGQYLRGTVALSASPSDTGVGVQSVDFQVSPANASSWSSIDVDTTSPYGAAWDTTLVADGLYDLRVVVTDNAGNSTASAAVEDRMVDNTAPNATMNDPGAYLRGTVGLTSNVSDAGSGVASVAYERSPANAGTWTSVPASWNTTSVADGLYDLRVAVTDNAGNSTTSAAVEDRTVDNTKPGLSTSDPFDGTTLAAAGALQVVASEDVSAIVGATIDGGAAPPASVTGDTVTYTQSFATGPHTLAGELEDLAGNRQPIRVHFTVWSGTASDYPYVEKNSFAAATMSLAATNAASTLTVPAGAWSGAPAGDWLVLRLDPQPSTGASGGFQPAGDVLDVTAYWALAGTGVTSFSTPLELEIDNTLTQVVPATFESGAWRTIAAVPGSSLPGSWQDGFERDGTNVRIFTRHLSRFTLLQDVQAPTVPGGFKGAVKEKKFSLSWTAASDNSGIVAGYRVYANNAVVKAVGGSTLTAAMGAFKTTDKKAYTLAAVDQAGNVGSRTYVLKVVPKVAKLTLSSAKKSLKKRGFKAGRVTYKASAKVPQGKVIKGSSTGLRRSGTKIGLTVSKGGGAAHRPVPSPYPPYPPAPPPSYTTPPPSYTTPPPPAPASPETSSPDVTATGTGTATPQRVRLAPHQLLLAESSGDFDSLRRELGFGLMAAAFTFAFLAGLRARRPREETEGADPELLWDSRALQSVGRAVRRLTGRP